MSEYKSVYRELEKLGYSTQPLYTGRDGRGKEIEFSVADLISGKVAPGSIKRWVGKSLSKYKQKKRSKE